MMSNNLQNTAPANPGNSRIIHERREYRTKHGKYFATEDHGGIAAVYQEAVHFQEEGEWKEIDNTLEEKSSSGTPEYQNRASSLKVTFAKYPDAPSLVTVRKEGHALSWNFRQNLRARSVPNEFQMIAGMDNKNTNLKTRAAVTEEETSGSPEEWNRKQMTIERYHSAGRYEEIAEGVDLEYLLTGEKLKENIVLKTKESCAVPLQFVYRHEGLAMERSEEGGIRVYRPEAPEETFYYLAPPCMYDGAGAYSGEVTYEMESAEGETVVRICPDPGWLSSDARVFPITIDPSTETSRSSKDIQDTFVREKYPDSSVVSTYGSFYVGNNDSYGKCRAFLKFNNLPEIPKGALIYDARLYVWQYKFSSYKEKNFYITAHRVNGPWTSGAATWNNQPSYDPTVLDYALVEEVQSGNTVSITPKEMNITKLVRDWYNTGVNNGIMLKMRDESIRSEGVFVTSDYPSDNIYGITSDQFPSGVFYYRDAAGLEDYYSYHDQSAGRAGTGYVNDFNGNLVWIHGDAGTKGNLLPVQLDHVYNLCDADRDSQFGRGWRLSIMQELKTTDIKDFPYVYVDSDGTSHYFYKDKDDKNKLKDEDGLGLTITQESSGNNDEYRIMEDKDEIKYIFGSDGYLRKIKDLNNNTQTAVYGPRTGGVFLDHITDGTGAKIQLHYNSDHSRLQSVEDIRGRHTSFTYDGSGHLQKITYPDGKSVSYSYSGDLLASVTNTDGYQLSYSYIDDFRVPRVSKVSESAGGVSGQELKISYKNGNTTVFEEPGLDGVLATGSDNQVMTYHFDNFGSPVDVTDEEGNSASYRYFNEGAKKHKLGKSGAMQRCIRNYLRNPGLELPKRFGEKSGNQDQVAFVEWVDAESDFGDGWHGYKSGDSVSYSITRDIGTGVFGDTSVLIDKYTTEEEGGICQETELAAGTYTFSAYVKTDQVIGEEKGSGEKSSTEQVLTGNKGANLCVKIGSASHYGERWLAGTTDKEIDGGWRRLSVTFTLDSTATVSACAGIFGTTGHAWFDCLQLEPGERPSRFNLINGGFFRGGSGRALEDWDMKNTDSSDGRGNDGERGSCAVLNGQPTVEKTLFQAVSVKGTSGDVFSFGCWAKADAIPGKRWQIGAAVIYASGDPKWVLFDGNAYVSDWQYVGGIISTKDDTGKNRNYTALHVYAFYKDQMNPLKLTDVQLLKDDGESYVYDDKGNLTGAESAAEKGAFSYNNKEQVSKMMDISGSSFEYGYDTKNNLVNARNTEGVQYNFNYDSRGNATALKAHGGAMTSSVTEGRVYYIRQRNSGKYMEAAGDSDGANVSQKSFTGGGNQQWKLLATDGGYYKFALQAGDGTRVLDIDGASANPGANVRVNQDTNGDGQKFKIKPLKDNTYQILPKCGKDKTALDNAGGTNEDGANIQTFGSENEENAAQLWYFEPADAELGTDKPEDGMILSIRAGHSGQYLEISGSSTVDGAALVQGYYTGKENQRFLVEKVNAETVKKDNGAAEQSAGGDSFLLKPLHAPEMALSVSGSYENYPAVVQRPADSGDKRQQFHFEKRGRFCAVVCDVTGDAWDVYSLRYTPGTAVIATGGTENLNANKLFVPEICSESINASMTYTGEGRNVKTVTDARGYVTTNEYDEKNDLLTAIVDARGNRTEYIYDTQNDQLTSVLVKNGDQTIQNTYTYDSGDRIKSIGRYGFSYNYEYDDFGNQKCVSVGEQKLENYTYLPHNGPVASVLYGNGAKTEYTYDKKFRVTAQSWDGQVCFRNAYDDYDALLRHEDLVNGVTYHYSHDMIGRLTGMDTSHGQALRIAYDGKNRVESIQQKIDNTSITTKYQYGEAKNQQSPGLIYGLEVDQKKRLTYEYDKLGRVTGKTWNLDGNHTVGMHLDYVPGKTPGTTTTLVESLTHGAERLSYTYDELGNIRTISENGTVTVTYTYDKLSQLIREDRVEENRTICYAYDGWGNLTAKKEYAYTEPDMGPVGLIAQKQYVYENESWRDQLTAYDGEAITYDEMGNPLNYRGMSMVWKKGQELQKLEKNGKTCVYSYNSEGVRVSKTIDGELTRYYLNGSSVVALKNESEIIRFIYDQAGNLFSMRLNGKDYYYVHNAQNDVIGLIDSSGVKVVNYQYDSWGNLLGMSDESGEKVGRKNPFRYRGYFWDEETNLYYASSRYYDPEIFRFISTDNVQALTVKYKNFVQYNLYAYCFNNPVNMLDRDGTWPEWIEKAVAVVVVATIVVTAAVVTVATFGAGSVAGVAAISATLTFTARATEVAVLQARKSTSEGKSTKKIVTNVIESIHDNGSKIIGITPLTKLSGMASMHVVSELAIRPLTGKMSFSSVSINQTLKMTGGKILPYGFVAYNWYNTINSLFTKNVVKRAMERRYTLK